jgi:hypothetical protein
VWSQLCCAQSERRLRAADGNRVCAPRLCGGLLLEVVPAQYLLPGLAVILLLSAMRVWRHASAPSHAGARDGTVFSFEPGDVRALTYMPLRFRMKLDLCGLHLSQRQWNNLPRSVRQSLIDAPCGTDQEAAKLHQNIIRAVQETGAGSVQYLEKQEPIWRVMRYLPRLAGCSTRCACR